MFANAGGTPAATVSRDGALRRPGHRSAMSLPRRSAEREREGSAAESIQRTKMCRVGRCPVTAGQQLASGTHTTHSPERENSRRRISRHCAPNLLFSRTRQRARFCSTAPARIVPFALQVWSETGTRFLPCRSSARPRRTRNDLRRRSMSRSQPQQLRSVWSRSQSPNSFAGVSTQMFSCVGFATGAISPGAMPPGGTTSVGSTVLPLG